MKTPLHICRELEGITQVGLARKCKTSTATISRLESGKAKCVSGVVCLSVIECFSQYELTLKHLIYPELFPDFSITKK